MNKTPFQSARRRLGSALALSLGLALSGCIGGMPTNASVESVNQPVVERTNYTFDLVTAPGGGVPLAEQRRLSGWLQAMDLRYGDRVALDDPMQSGATRAAVESLISRSGLLLADGAPVTVGYVNPGNARVVITRSTASVPNCPNWSVKGTSNFHNATSPGYGCAVNSNLAGMIANPEHLLKGEKGISETVATSSNKAVDSYRDAQPTGKSGPKSGGM